MVKNFTGKFVEGRKCIYCGKYKPYRLANKRVKCGSCGRFYSLSKLRCDLDILHYFALELSANKTADVRGFNHKTVHSSYMFFRRKMWLSDFIAKTYV